MSEAVITYPELDRPTAFTQDEIGWVPWLQPMAVDDLTDRHWAALVDRARANSPYFMLLARDPAILEARTKTDKDIFYNPEAGLPRAERELSALAASRFNGCIFCGSVHARFAAHHSKRRNDVQRLLDGGVETDVGGLWNAIVRASVALTTTPIAFGREHIAARARPALTISRSPTSSTVRHSSIGRTASCSRSASRSRRLPFDRRRSRPSGQLSRKARCMLSRMGFVRYWRKVRSPVLM